MAKKIQIIIILFALVSCQSKQEKLIGHWHEFKVNDSDYLNCYRITDSTIGINSLSNGGFNDYRRGLDLEQSEILSLANGNYKWTSDFIINGNKLILNDSIFWIKQTDKRTSFLTDFSAGLLVDINPFESKKSIFDFQPNQITNGNYIFVGKLKNSVWEKHTKFNKEEYYIQLNDKISKPEDIVWFMDCGHCDITKQLVYMHVDKNTPKELLSEIETEMSKININKRQIYYLTINRTELVSGYNHSY
jgi:hypothetical protein